MSTRHSDSDLWKAITNDNHTAFSLLFDRYWSVIYKTVFAYLKDRAQSEEITHDIFLNLWRGRHTLTIRSFPAYVRASARYHVYRCMKSAITSPISYVDNWDAIPAPKVTNAGDDQILVTELETNVDGLLTDLPARCREIFLLSRKEALTNEEIATRLGISKRSVENQITRALKHLRIQLKALIVFLGVVAYVCFTR